MSREGRLAPMKAVSGDLPRSSEWAYEIKWDGMRALVSLDRSGVAAWSSRLNDIGHRFPELEAMRVGIGDLDAIFDGELVALGDDGLPSFERLQKRIHLDRRHDIELQMRETPVAYVVFDLLRLDGNETLELPYENRRSLLEQLIEPGPTWQLASSHSGDGDDLLAVVEAQGLEGIVSKRRQSPYRPGSRSRDWIKTKVDRRQEFVVGGIMSGEGGRSGGIGALLVGVYDGEDLRFAGRVGSGLSDDESRRIGELSVPLRRSESPFLEPVEVPSGRSIQFLDPSIVVEVRFTEWTRDSNLRHPVYMGLRSDVDPTTVIREPDQAARRES